MSFFYRVYGVVLESNLPLPLPECARCESYLKAEFKEFIVSSLPKVAMTTEETSISGGFQWRVKGGDVLLGKALLSDTNLLKIDYSREFGQQATIDAFLHPLLARVLRYRGATGLHGSAVSHQGFGLVFLGESGQGKSTLAQAFVQKGARFLSDDVAFLRHDEERGWRVQAGATGLRLELPTPKAKRVFSLHALDQPEHSVKYELDCLDSSRDGSLDVILVLSSGTRTSMSEVLEPKERLIELLRNRFSTSLLSAVAKERDLRQLSKVAEEVRVLRLERPRDLDRLEAQVDLIMSSIAKPTEIGQGGEQLPL